MANGDILGKLELKGLKKVNKPELSAKTKRQTQQSMGVLLGVIAIGLILFLVVRPRWAEITASRQEITANTGLLEQMTRKQEALKQAQANYSQIEPDLAVIDEAIGDYSDLGLAMQLLEKMASEIVDEGGPLIINSVSVTEADIPADTPLTAEPGVRKLESQETLVTLSLTGDYQALRDFIIKITGLRHNFAVERLVFSSNNNNSSQNQYLNASLTLRYNYFN